jgi:glycosidase
MAQKSITTFALSLAAVLALGDVLAGCGSSPAGRCPLTVWYRPARLDASLAGVQPELVGSWDNWSRPGLRSFTTVTADDGTVWSTATLQLPPGTYQYAVAFGSSLILDELNPRSAFVAGDMGPLDDEVSEVVLADCSAPQFSMVSSTVNGAKLAFAADFTPGGDGVTLDPASLSAAITQAGKPIAAAMSVAHSDGGQGITHVTANVAALAAGKYTLTVTARDRKGRMLSTTGSAFVTTTTTAPAARGDELVYQVIVDRFAGAAGALPPLSSPGDRAGGTLDGVRAALERGYFDSLGVTTLWISPAYTNTANYEISTGPHLVTPYHGYWPEAPRTVDPRLGGEAALDALVASAHARGLRVILDVVPNHVYKAHPYYAQHSRMSAGITQNPTPATKLDTLSWFNDGPNACVCGDPGCDWGANMETCWFADYLPDLNWRHPAVMQQGADDLVFWMSRFDLDGLRIDAVPMMPRAAERRMLAALHGMMFRAPQDLLVVGEVYTGPGDPGREQIRAYLGSQLDGLDSAFDFPLMWAVRDALAHNSDGGFATLENELAAGIAAWNGSGATIARMIGNHDTTRFISEVAGDADGDPWSAPPPQPSDPAAYQHQLLALAYVMTAPGIPVLYYGDEVGLAGGGDPDSRRVMPDPSSLPPAQAALLDAVGKIGRARRCSAALRGTRAVALADADHLAAIYSSASAATTTATTASTAEDSALVVLSRDAADATLSVPNVPAGTWQDALSGATFTSDGAVAQIAVPSLTAAVYLPKESACLR